jgi:hypothetical protein
MRPRSAYKRKISRQTSMHSTDDEEEAVTLKLPLQASSVFTDEFLRNRRNMAIKKRRSGRQKSGKCQAANDASRAQGHQREEKRKTKRKKERKTTSGMRQEN